MEKKLSKPKSILLGTAYVVAGASLLYFGIMLISGTGTLTYPKK